MCNRHVVLWATSVAGAVCILLGALALTLIPKIVEHSVEDRQFLGYTTDSNGTEQYNEVTEKWIHPPYHMQLQVWIYNVVNEADILKGAKPQVREIGPFTFRESMEKTVHNFVDNGTRVFYRNTRRYFFNRTASCAECSLDKRVTIANVLFQKLVDIALMGTAQKLAVEAVLVAAQRETPFLTITAGEALFQGYKDPLLETLCDHAILSSICKSLQLPERIGFFYGQNNTDDGLYEIDTGLTDRQKLAKVYSWNNKTILPESWWDNKQARMINGTDGQLFPPLLRTGASLDLFAAQACRSVVLEYKGQNEVEGVPAYRYTVPNELYDPSRPENLGFCNKNNTPTFFENTTIQSSGCLPAGLLDVSRCQPGQPRVYISQAHFYSSPEEVRNAVDGICEPSDEHDSTIVYIEGITGAVVRAVRRAQINIGMRKGNLNVLNKTRNVIVPVLWLNETAHFDEETRDEMKNQLWSVKHWAFASGLALLFVGIALWLAFIGVYLVPTFCQNPSEEEQLLVDDSALGDVVVDAAD